MAARCPVCHATDVQPFAFMPQLPVYCNVQWSSREEALRAPRADIELGFCHHCGHVYNLAFRPKLMEYTQAYDSSLDSSPRFQQYAKSLARRLVDRYDLHGKDIIDIGCGKGEFLTLLCALGENRGVGFDPAYVPERTGDVAAGQVTFVQDYYSDEYADYPADLVCCRHVLEHLQDPLDFLAMVRRALDGKLGAALYFEVPNVLFTLYDLGIWDIIYEHCSYFSPSSLATAFHATGYEVQDLTTTYANQFLCVEARLAETPRKHEPGRQEDLSQMAHQVAAFEDEYRRKVAMWRANLEQIADAGQRAVIWGTGSKGVTFLNTFRAGGQVAYAVDISPHKEGRYVAGTGQKIVAPEFLRGYKPDVVIVMNPIYRDEIQQFMDGLDVDAEVLVA